MMRSLVNANCVTHFANTLGMELDTPGKRLKWARLNRTAYKDATAAARAFDWKVSTYLGHENGDRIPSRAKAMRYGAVYKVPWSWILEGGPLPEGEARDVESPIPDDRPPPLPASALSSPPGQAAQGDRRDNPLPVWASAEGGEDGAMLITPGPIDWIPRPLSAQVAGSFAVYLIGDSMSPAYENGDQIYVNPHRPIESGQDCLFVRELEDGTLVALARRLVRARPDKWRVRQFSPETRDFDLDRQKWRKAWLIVGKTNRG